MAVTKLPRRRKGTLPQRPPLSWPNDTVIGRRRPHLGLLRQATHNSQQRRLSELSASSKRNVSKPIRLPALHSQAPQASDYSRYKAHQQAHLSTQQPNTPRTLGKPPKQNKKPAPQATQLRKKSRLSSSLLTDEKEDAKSRQHSHIGNHLSLPPSHRSRLEMTPVQ